MKNIKNNTKKWITIIACLTICIVLIVLISKQFQSESIKDKLLKSENSKASDATLQIEKTETIAEKEIKIDLPSIPIEKETSDEEIYAGTEQSIQNDVTKPKYTDEQLTNPNQKPNGEKVAEPPKSTEHDKAEPPKDLSQNPKTETKAEPKKDDKPNETGTAPQDLITKPKEDKPGYDWFPGFGWVPYAGENKVIEAEDMYENGNKVGEMD